MTRATVVADTPYFKDNAKRVSGFGPERCNFVVQYFGLGLSTSSFYVFQETFGDNTTNTIGVARIAMTMDWMREIDFIYPSASYHYVIAVCEKDLPSAGDGAFFIALFAGVPVVDTFIVIALIFVLLAGLITSSEVVIKQLSTSSSVSSGISALTHSLFRLYTIAFGQDGRLVVPPEHSKYGIAIYDDALVPIDQAVFFNALFHRDSVTGTLAVIALIFVAVGVLNCRKL
ncbi:hypothetical protein BV898_19405 [Hypsibius exemplaris]|uniref:Uncharacterized protein n=1 Tax=Hypsibius exemplaris TaxID=2072580 RepID=A0A9X6NIW6_HYPEX|nr:hypothetical protein BV898_19405 [Hypsibius exemplaris]